jgi:outer membrane protein assembly factor BamB
MAVVYLGRQPDLDRDVAIKELATFYAGDPSFVQRFLRESRIAGSLSHPNIVTVYDFFEHEETLYIAMEYVPRGSLRPVVSNLTLAQAAGALEGVLSALSYAANRGIVHRDLKPENLLVTQEGAVKIADFGIAKVYDAGRASGQPMLTVTGMTVGTPHYMAPEQALGKEIGPGADLYSVGVIAYEMLVGRVPFDAPTPAAVLMQHLNEEIPPPLSLKPDLHPAVAQWLGSMLAKTPEERIRSPEQAWDTLDEIVISVLGPRWRREARLHGGTPSGETSRPLTPAPFRGEGGGETVYAGDSGVAAGRGDATVLAGSGSQGGSGSAGLEARAPTQLAGSSSPVPMTELAGGGGAAVSVPSEAVPRLAGRRRLWLALAVAAILVAAAAAGAFLLLGGGGGGGSEPKLLWQLRAGGFVGSSPTVSATPGGGSQARVFFGSQNQNLYAVDAQKGTVLWKFETGRTIFSSPTVADGVVYVGSHDGNLYALDERTGDEKWRFQTESTVQSSPTVADGLVVVGSDDGRVYGLHTDGEEQWRFETGAAVFSSPAIDDGTVYIGSRDGSVYALEADTGKKHWKFDTGNEVWSSPMVAQETVYVGSNDGKLYALDVDTGKERWSFTTGDVISSSPFVDGGSVYIGSFDHNLYALNALTGDERWRFETGDTVFSSPTVSQGVVYVGSHDKHLYAIDAAAGTELWRFETKGVVGSSPTVFGGVVYVGSDDGNVYALQTPES